MPKSSSDEEHLLSKLVEMFGKNDVFRQYSSDLYPYCSDFYIASKDLYIELNYSWFHGYHRFDKESSEDLNIVKAKQNKSKAYNSFINTWTITDVEKVKTAKENELNYIVIYPNCFVDEFIEKLNEYNGGLLVLGECTKQQHNIKRRVKKKS